MRAIIFCDCLDFQAWGSNSSCESECLYKEAPGQIFLLMFVFKGLLSSQFAVQTQGWRAGASCNMVSIICPLVEIGLNDLPKSRGKYAPPPDSAIPANVLRGLQYKY